jgi:hypothetical protein
LERLPGAWKKRGILRHIPILILGALGSAAVSGAERHDLAAVARSILGADQGVYVEAADGTALLAQSADKPVHPASVSKVPTTLALLRKFGPEHRFVTTFAANGPVHDGTLEGDLLVESDGDPYFVDENALLVVERLNQLGVRRVAGNLRPRGVLTFDWEVDADGARLRQAMSGMAPGTHRRRLRAPRHRPPFSSPTRRALQNPTPPSRSPTGCSSCTARKPCCRLPNP